MHTHLNNAKSIITLKWSRGEEKKGNIVTKRRMRLEHL